ncbi:SHOCT domain-containing protein [Arcobacter arenosus]|jgi:putative membrane protein|uniref:SHOCT domain-containing protein n=1 Tax=Arcobacter arenosus TaxID=2576037 RepID=UPI003BA9CF58
MFNGYHGGFGMMGFGWIFFILIIALVIYLLSNKSDKKSAKDILDERYAKGEIDLEEYQERKKNLLE